MAGTGREQLQDLLGHDFESPERLERALTHSSWPSEKTAGSADLSAHLSARLSSERVERRQHSNGTEGLFVHDPCIHRHVGEHGGFEEEAVAFDALAAREHSRPPRDRRTKTGQGVNTQLNECQGNVYRTMLNSRAKA